MAIRGIEAVIFDLDGTLIDSEVNTDRAVVALLDDQGIDHAELELSQFHGIMWDQVAARLVELHPELAAQPVASLLQDTFHRRCLDDLPPPIDGAFEALAAASRSLPVAVATSSSRPFVERILGQLDLARHVQQTVCAEDCTRSKPDPQCYLLAADRLGCAPEHGLVFEDSTAGLQAAGRAGMRTIAVTHRRTGRALAAVQRLADHAIADFTELEPGFFARIGKEDAP